MPSRKRWGANVALIFTAAMVAAVLGMSAVGVAQDRGLKSLRGDVELDQANAPPAVVKQEMPPDGMFGRAYRQQPPLIPHRVDGYQVTKDFNQCMTCHDWPANLKAGAPKVSETHYNDREGQRLDRISGTRYFCTQCHVPQLDAKPLVRSTFQNATEVK